MEIGGNNSRSSRLYDSEIKGMIDLMQSSKATSFTAGEPSLNPIPSDRLRVAFPNAFKCDKRAFGYYHDPAGFVELRE